MQIINVFCRKIQRKSHLLLIIIIFSSLVIATWYFIGRLPKCQHRSDDMSLFSSRSSYSTVVTNQSWQIPDWVQRYNASHLFDWTWHKNGDFERCRTPIIFPPRSSACSVDSPTVTHDVLAYFRSHPHEGCIVDNVARLPNLIPHPLPRTRSLSDTCSSLHIDHGWILCRKPQSELDNWLPATTRFVTIAVFNAYIDTGSCHSEVPGVVFTERATFYFQRWTNNRCNNDAIHNIPRIEPAHQHTELIDSIGHYFQAPGHFGPQQLPRLLRLLATVPTTAKVLVAKGGVADSLVDVLVERGIVTRDRIVPFDKTTRPNHFANIVYRSDPWPYLNDKNNGHYFHDRTDMQLIHRVLAANEQPSMSRKDRVILIKRQDGKARSIVEHSDLAAFISSALNKSKISVHLHLEIFEAQGHIRDHIALFRQARVIVGPHGAGMMNVLWSSPGTHVVEIGYTDGMTFPEMYAEMSLHLDQHYWICKGHGNYGAPIHVDMNDFIHIFNQIIHEFEIENHPS